VDQFDAAVVRPERPDGIQFLEHLADLGLGIPLLTVAAQHKIIDQGLPDGIVLSALPALLPQVIHEPVEHFIRGYAGQFAHKKELPGKDKL